MPGEPEEGRLADAAGREAERRPVRHTLGDPATVGPNAGLSNVIPRTHGEAGTPNAERRAPNAGRTCVLISVADSGPGLDPKDLGRLFNTFYTTKPQGLGMGLSISRSIVEAHKGRLWAKANVPKGALFQFTLPIANDYAPEVRVVDTGKDMIESSSSLIRSNKTRSVACD